MLRFRAPLAAVCAAVTVGLTACTPAPPPLPRYVTDLGAEGGGDGAPGGPAQTRGPQWVAPKTDALAWRDCESELAGRLAVPRAAGSTEVRCATLTAPANHETVGGPRIALALTRVSRPETPADAPPLIVASGTTLTGQRAAMLLAQQDSPLVRARPVITVDRRGTGQSDPLVCIPPAQRQVFDTGGAARPGLPIDARVDALREAAVIASTDCGDQLGPLLTHYGPIDAAGDLETIRGALGVPALGLMSIGDGADTVLAYAAAHPKRVARLILDTPTRYGGTQIARTEDLAKGTRAALTAFADQCRALDCALGDDPAAALAGAFSRAAAGDLGRFTDTDLMRAVTVALASGPGTRTERIGRVSDAVAAARAGQSGPLTAVVAWAVQAAYTDGQLIARCSDSAQQAGTEQVVAAARDWADRYPPAGAPIALAAMHCGAWPAMPALPPLGGLEVPAVLALGAADPFSTTTVTDVLAGQLSMAGARPATVTWAGLGSAAVLRSTCMQTAVDGYLADLGAPNTRACPA